jgi:V8-like Glu-specific endopeptidase
MPHSCGRALDIPAEVAVRYQLAVVMEGRMVPGFSARSLAWAAVALPAALIQCDSAAAQPKIVEDGVVTRLVLDDGEAKVDFVKAAPLNLPISTKFSDEDANKTLKAALSVTPGEELLADHSSESSLGTGIQSASELGEPNPPSEGRAPTAFGTANLPFSTARADLDQDATNTRFPYRAAGKLFFVIKGRTYICSASLIERGVVVTAAHCVAEFGKKAYHTGWQFVPGYRNGVAPYNAWTAAEASLLTSYYDGSDACAEAGVVCQDDVAVLVLQPQKDANGQPYYAGDRAGWYSYGWDRSGFTPQFITHVTQIGYPACLDDAAYMERNDSEGAIAANFANNTVIGSLMCGGSSGGPWLINFGVQPKLKGIGFGFAAKPNEVIGVTSWGSTDEAVKWMGASPFLSTNIVPLMDAACKAHPEACKGDPPNP